MDVVRMPDASLFVRISCHIPAEKIVSEIKGLVKILKMFGTSS